MRQLVWAHHRNRTGFCIDHRLPSEYYEQSRFCLAPSGDGWGDRLQKSVRAGCVPVRMHFEMFAPAIAGHHPCVSASGVLSFPPVQVIVQPGVLMPFEELLPYHRFSLRYGAAEIPTLHERLAKIGDAEHARMRRALLRYAPAFNWHEGEGRAYELAIYSLCLRGARLAANYTAGDVARCDLLRPAMLTDPGSRDQGKQREGSS